VDIRPVSREEFPAFVGTFNRAMGFPPASEHTLEVWRRAGVPERSIAAFDRDQIVGTVYSYDFELTLPGRVQIDAAGVTAVGVLPTHKRRGLLTGLKTRQLREAKERGEALAILIASESVIYGRFGYGVSSYLFDVEIETRWGAFRPGLEDIGGRVSFVDEATADKIFPEVYERWWKQQPGAVPRTDEWWWLVRQERKPGAEAHVIYESDDGEVEGYIRYSTRSKWDAGLADSTIAGQDFVTITPRSRRALWRHVLDVDLVRSVGMGAQAVDDPIRWWLANPRALKVTRYGDFIWTRVLDIARSLATRRYRLDTELVLEIDDAMFGDNSGRYLLAIAGGEATCERTDRSPDLVMPVSSVGCLLLGGVSASSLARGGRIEERSDGALARCDAAFSSEIAPWSATWF
jgi:predicted acetyltransferase